MRSFQVLGFIDKRGNNVDDFKRAVSVMLFNGQYSVPAKAKEFKKPIKIGQVVSK